MSDLKSHATVETLYRDEPGVAYVSKASVPADQAFT